MLHADGAEVGPDGTVTLLESVHLARRVPAVVTIVGPVNDTAPARASGKALLDILDSEDFATAQPGDPERMEHEIAANRA